MSVQYTKYSKPVVNFHFSPPIKRTAQNVTKLSCGCRLVSCSLFLLHIALLGLGGKPEGKGNLEDPGVDRRIILRWIFRKWYMGISTGSNCVRTRTGEGTLVNAVINLQVP